MPSSLLASGSMLSSFLAAGSALACGGTNGTGFDGASGASFLGSSG